jgi:hypothetical protein
MGMWRPRVLATWLAAACVSGCGATSTAPTQTPGPTGLDLSGQWSGTWQYVTASLMVTETVVLTVTQSHSSATGTWTAEGGAVGSISLGTGATISGTFVIWVTTFGGSCSAASTLTGTASATDLRFSVQDLTPTSGCQWSTHNQFVLHHN